MLFSGRNKHVLFADFNAVAVFWEQVQNFASKMQSFLSEFYLTKGEFQKNNCQNIVDYIFLRVFSN